MRGKRRLIFVAVLVLLLLMAAGAWAARALSRPEAAPAPTAISSPTVSPSHSPTPVFTGTSTPSTTASATDTPVLPTDTPTPAPTMSTQDALADGIVPARDPISLAERLKGVPAPIPRVVRETAPVYQIGDRERFWVGDGETVTHFEVTATLRYSTTHVYMWVQEGYEVPDADLARSAERFEMQTYPTNRANFGSEWIPGVDNDPHIHIFNGRVPGVAGYFYSPSEFSRSINPFSNEREMFFVNLDARWPGTAAYDSTLAHEFQHMIHWYNDQSEDTWVNEGLSMLAEQLNGFSVVDYANAYLRTPDTQLTSWSLVDGSAVSHYGASYLFMSYFHKRFGQDAVRALVQSPRNGAAAFDEVLGALSQADMPLTFDSVFADWVIANYLDDPLVAGGRYGYADLELLEPAAVVRHQRYPLSQTGTVRQYGVDYVVLSAGEDAGDLEIRFTGRPEVALADMQPLQGSWMWWSGRSDNMDATLTRAFDLRTVDRATLSAWVWYDVEENWDYAYIEASVDGGSTWQTLAGSDTLQNNPNGNNMGWSFTGKSGGDLSPQWVETQVDLMPFVGREVLLRFEVVTDDAVNNQGLFMDDLAIPEIGYYEDFEEDGGDWVSEGFVRTDNRLPQRYLVQIVTFAGQDVQVEQMALDEWQTGRLVLSNLGARVDQALLIISAMAPATSEFASYRYEIRRLETADTR